MKMSSTSTGIVAGSIVATAVALGVPTAVDADAAHTATRVSAEPESQPVAEFISKWKGYSLDGKSNGD